MARAASRPRADASTSLVWNRLHGQVVSVALASSLTCRASRTVAEPGPGTRFTAGRRAAAGRSGAGAGRPPRSRAIQGHHQGTHAVRRPPAGHRSQPRRGRLDRGAAQELWLSHRAHQVRIRHAAAGHHGRRAARRARRRRARRDQGNKRPGQGGSTIFGTTARTGVNNDPNVQPDEKLRALNTQPATDGPREEVYCTKVGSKTPGEMYIIGAHMDGMAGAKRPTTTGRARRS